MDCYAFHLSYLFQDITRPLQLDIKYSLQGLNYPNPAISYEVTSKQNYHSPIGFQTVDIFSSQLFFPHSLSLSEEKKNK